MTKGDLINYCTEPKDCGFFDRTTKNCTINRNRIDIEDVYRLEEEISRINKIKRDDIELYHDGKRVELSEKTLADWKFIGPNYYFITKVLERK